MQVERTGSERVFQRIGQEYSANIHTVDVVNSSDAAHFIYWKQHGMLQPFLSPEMADNYAPTSLDPDGALGRDTAVYRRYQGALGADL